MIKFNWTTVGRSTLTLDQETVAEYIEMVVKQLQALTFNQFIVKSQTK